MQTTMAYRHMTQKELRTIDVMQRKGSAASNILKKLEADREKLDESGPSESALYRYLSGQGYERGAEETRGRGSTLPKNLVKVAVAERAKLAEKTQSQWLVTWADVHAATKKKLQAQGVFKKGVKMPSESYLQRKVRENTEIRARPGKRRITHEKDQGGALR